MDFDRACAKCGDTLDLHAVGPGGRRTKIDTLTCPKCRRRNHYKVTTRDLAERDGAKCALCGEPVSFDLTWPDPMYPTRDHIVPFSLGGSDDPDNLQLAHSRCNRRKFTKTA